MEDQVDEEVAIIEDPHGLEEQMRMAEAMNIDDMSFEQTLEAFGVGNENFTMLDETNVDFFATVNIQSDFFCPICQEPKQPQATWKFVCDHWYCADCVKNTVNFASQNCCSICRRVYFVDGLPNEFVECSRSDVQWEYIN